MVSSRDLVRILTTNSTGSFGSLIPRTTAPAPGVNHAVFDLWSQELGWGSANHPPSHFQVIPFGSDAADETFSMRLWGWDKVSNSSLWIPQLIADLAVILGTLSGAAIGTNHLMADSITVSDGPADNGDWGSVISDGANLAASIVLATRGCRYLTAEFNLGTAAGANAFIRPVNI